MSEKDIIKIAASVSALIVAIVGHEIMHGWVAWRYGDSTARSMGRLSINPLVHIDPIGTILIPAILYFSNAPFLFGWAKPVPVNIDTVMRNGGAGAAVAVSLAGIVYNLVAAGLFATLLPLFYPPQSIWSAFAYIFIAQSVILNVVLAVFNLWPIPPLDGAQALRYLAVKFRWQRFMEFYDRIYPYGMVILMAVLFTPLSSILFTPVEWILMLILP